MKLLAPALALLSLVAATPLPDANAAPNPITGDGPRPTTPYTGPGIPKPTPDNCGPIVCIRAPCLNSCCPSGKRSCPPGWTCTLIFGKKEGCCPPNWLCAGPDLPRPCRDGECDPIDI